MARGEGTGSLDIPIELSFAAMLPNRPPVCITVPAVCLTKREGNVVCLWKLCVFAISPVATTDETLNCILQIQNTKLR